MTTKPAQNTSALIGQQGEDAATNLLRKKKYKILHRNWRPSGSFAKSNHGLELDIIAQYKKSIIFVEVKTRQLHLHENIPPHANFTRNKQLKMLRAAHTYLSTFEQWNVPCRFDMISVTIDTLGKTTLEHFEHVVEIGNIMDSSNTSWQPW